MGLCSAVARRQSVGERLFGDNRFCIIEAVGRQINVFIYHFDSPTFWMNKAKCNACKQGINHHLAAGSPLGNHSKTAIFVPTYFEKNQTDTKKPCKNRALNN